MLVMSIYWKNCRLRAEKFERYNRIIKTSQIKNLIRNPITLHESQKPVLWEGNFYPLFYEISLTHSGFTRARIMWHSYEV
jgi:hypothetical protein